MSISETPKLCECGCGQPAPIATETDARRGWVRGQPLRFIRYHKAAPTVEERFRRDVPAGLSPDVCWEWQGTRLPPRGYGQFTIRGVAYAAHRVSYELHVGPIPDGLFVCHHCDNPPCVNPAHLFTGTAQDNNLDTVNKGRGNYYTPAARAKADRQRGEGAPAAKLDAARVREIRRLRQQGLTTTQLAARFGVSTATIKDILRGRTWSHIR